jgi:uncharacterized protein
MSDIRIDTNGVWYYRGNEMTRRDILTRFYQHLLHDESGSYFIELGPQRYQVDVEDTAFVVWAVLWAEGNEASLLLSDETIEELDPSTLRIGRDNILYCRVKNSRFDARFSRSSYYRLAERIEYDPQRDACFISMTDCRHYIRT